MNQNETAAGIFAAFIMLIAIGVIAVIAIGMLWVVVVLLTSAAAVF